MSIPKTKKSKYKPSSETKAKISKALMGHYVSADTRMKMSLSRRGDKHAFYGKHLSESTKEKIRIANTGRQQSEATKHKISVKNIEAWKRRKRKGKRSSNKE